MTIKPTIIFICFIIGAMVMPSHQETTCYKCSGDYDECKRESLNINKPEQSCTLTGNTDICYKEKIVKDGKASYILDCKNSTLTTNGKTHNCDSYTFFGVKHVICACQTNACNSGSSINLSTLAIFGGWILMVTLAGINRSY